MTRLTVFTIFLFVFCAAQAESDTVQTEPGATQKQPEFTDEQLARFKAAEEEYKDNPALMKIITRLKESYGISDEPPAAEAPPPPEQPEPAFTGSRTEAEQAYLNKDYETAMKQYKALAEAGDSEASLILGTMYDLGQGADPDPAAAQAWFRKAAEDGNQQGRKIMGLYQLKPMSPDEQARADQVFEEINKESDEKKKDDSKQPVSDSRTDRSINLTQPQNAAFTRPSVPYESSRSLFTVDTEDSAKLAVEKFDPMPHLKTTTVPASGWQPEKIQKTVPSGFEKYNSVPASR